MQGKNIQAKDARKHIAGYFLAIDFTNRGLGGQFKKDGAPWCLQKGSDGFTAISDFIDVRKLQNHQDIQLKLKVNDKLRQDFNTSEMIHKIDDQIAFLSKYMNLNDGDMILTGTGGGIDKVVVGDSIETQML